MVLTLPSACSLRRHAAGTWRRSRCRSLRRESNPRSQRGKSTAAHRFGRRWPGSGHHRDALERRSVWTKGDGQLDRWFRLIGQDNTSSRTQPSSGSTCYRPQRTRHAHHPRWVACRCRQDRRTSSYATARRLLMHSPRELGPMTIRRRTVRRHHGIEIARRVVRSQVRPAHHLPQGWSDR